MRSLRVATVAAIVALCFAGSEAASRQPIRHLPVRRRVPKPALRNPQLVSAPATVRSQKLSPPDVSYHDGLLSISARNSTLREILEEIQRCTGATISVPAAINEPVAVHLGPAPAAQVIAAMLAGSRFNYIITGVASDPGAVESIILTLKPAGTKAYVPPPQAAANYPPTESRTVMKANLTGGDEGVWDDVDIPAQVLTPAPQQ